MVSIDVDLNGLIASAENQIISRDELKEKIESFPKEDIINYILQNFVDEPIEDDEDEDDEDEDDEPPEDYDYEAEDDDL